MRRAALAFAFCLLVTVHAGRAAERGFTFESTYGELPKAVVPSAYAIALVPNVAALTFTGHVRIAVDVRAASATIVLNTSGLTIDGATIDGASVPSSTDAAAETTTLTPSQPVATGAHVLTLDYHGPIGTSAQGIYSLPFKQLDGTPATMLSTMFESADARRMFPCFDEPVFRASFALTITVPKAWTATANMPIAARVESGDTATVTFAPTPPMATYLVHVTAGPYAALRAAGGRVPQAVWAPAGTESDGAYALASAERILPLYEAYFAQPFPLPKLDHIAIPGGFSGAMENWGAIAYRSDLLLLKPSSTEGARETVFAVMSHEMAHQWFGDLVTMAWWDDLWLNESFAEWMAVKATDGFNPTWHYRERYRLRTERALDADADLTSLPIRRPVTHGRDVNSSFDGIIQYVKGEAVMQMLEAYVGPDTFRAGLRAYMAAHRFSNTTGADLWSALDRVSGKPVDAVAATWLEQPGYPLVSVTTRCDAGRRRATFAQQRFLIVGTDAAHERWLVPIAYAAGSGPARHVLLRGAATTVAAGRCNGTLRANVDARGFYRVADDAPTMAANLRGFATLPDIDKLTMLGDTWALARAGRVSPVAFIRLAEAMHGDRDPAVWMAIATTLAAIDDAERGKPGRAAFRAAALRLIAPVTASTGWDAEPGEEPAVGTLRQQLIRLAGTFGDPAIVAEAQRRFEVYRRGELRLSPDDQAAVFPIVGRSANAAAYDELAALASGPDRDVARRAIAAMVLAEDPVLRRRALEFVVSPARPAEDAALRIGWVYASAAVDPAMAWQVFTANENALFAPVEEFGRGGLARAAVATFGDGVPLDVIASNLIAAVPEAAAGIAASVERAHVRAIVVGRIVPPIDAYAAHAAGKPPGPQHVM